MPSYIFNLNNQSEGVKIDDRLLIYSIYIYDHVLSDE